jgi:hypothetical protein
MGVFTAPGALTLLVCVCVQSFLVHSIGERGVCGASVNQSNVTEDTDVDAVHSEVLDGTQLSDVVQELFTVSRDARSLHDAVLSEELAEALDIVELVGVDVVPVELLEDRPMFGGLVGVVHFLIPFVCSSVFAAGGVSFRCGVRDVRSATLSDKRFRTYDASRNVTAGAGRRERMTWRQTRCARWSSALSQPPWSANRRPWL